MAKFTVRKGRRYRATIKLTGLKRWAGNDTIAGIFRNVGFTQVKVEGDGSTRIAEGLWSLDDASADIPPEVTQVIEIDGTPQTATRLAGAKRRVAKRPVAKAKRRVAKRPVAKAKRRVARAVRKRG